MKVIISKPGIPIEKINKDSFFAVSNNNKSPIGGASLWNGMMLIGNILYTCSSGHPILYAELPLFDKPNKYSNILKNKYIIKTGNAEFFGNKIISREANNIILNKEIKLNSSKYIYTDVMPYTICECGLIFGFNKHFGIDNYFLFLLSREGYINVKKIYENKMELILNDTDSIHNNFNKENIYELYIKFDFFSYEIKISVNEKEIFKLKDKSLIDSKIGFFSSNNGTVFSQLLIKQN